MNRFGLALLLLNLPVSLFSQTTIDEKEVTRIIKTLASDDMNGRKAFTPDADKTVEFLTSEFAKTGLQYFGSLTSYVQSFPMYHIKSAEISVTVNGTAVSSTDIIYSGTYETVKWEKTPPVLRIEQTDNFWDKMDEFNSQKTDAVVLVHPDHHNSLSWLKRRQASGRYVFEKESGISKVFVMTTDSTVKTLNLSIKNDIRSVTGKNVVGVLPGSERPKEFVLFSAHYDHIGIMNPVDGDSIANGADDDASGVTAVLTLANHFKQLSSNKRTLVFVLFTAEEIGGFGSEYFSKQLNPDQVTAMFNIEMIGKPSIFGENSGFMTGFDKSSLGEIITRSLEKAPYKIHPDPYPKQQLFYRSDNATLAALGVPAHSFSSDPIDVDKFYHTVNDEVETLDLKHMTQMIKAIAAASESIVSAKETPTRVEKRK